MVLKLAKNRKNVVVLSMGMCSFCEEFSRFFPERYFCLGRAAGNLVGVAAGMALRGKMPIIVVESGFLEQSFDQLKQLLCLPNLNVKILGDGSEEDLAMVNLLPGMKVANFEDAVEEFGVRYVVND